MKLIFNILLLAILTTQTTAMVVSYDTIYSPTSTIASTETWILPNVSEGDVIMATILAQPTVSSSNGALNLTFGPDAGGRMFNGYNSAFRNAVTSCPLSGTTPYNSSVIVYWAKGSSLTPSIMFRSPKNARVVPGSSTGTNITICSENRVAGALLFVDTPTAMVGKSGSLAFTISHFPASTSAYVYIQDTCDTFLFATVLAGQLQMDGTITGFPNARRFSSNTNIVISSSSLSLRYYIHLNGVTTSCASSPFPLGGYDSFNVAIVATSSGTTTIPSSSSTTTFATTLTPSTSTTQSGLLSDENGNTTANKALSLNATENFFCSLMIFAVIFCFLSC